MSKNENAETLPPVGPPWYRAKYEVQVWQWIGVWITILLVVFGGIWGFARYISDSEVRACQVSVTSRSDLRGVILGIYDAIEADGSNDLVQRLREQLDEDYGALTFDECMNERYGR